MWTSVKWRGEAKVNIIICCGFRLQLDGGGWDGQDSGAQQRVDLLRLAAGRGEQLEYRENDAMSRPLVVCHLRHPLYNMG